MPEGGPRALLYQRRGRRLGGDDTGRREAAQEEQDVAQEGELQVWADAEAGHPEDAPGEPQHHHAGQEDGGDEAAAAQGEHQDQEPHVPRQPQEAPEGRQGKRREREEPVQVEKDRRGGGLAQAGVAGDAQDAVAADAEDPGQEGPGPPGAGHADQGHPAEGRQDEGGPQADPGRRRQPGGAGPTAGTAGQKEADQDRVYSAPEELAQVPEPQQDGQAEEGRGKVQDNFQVALDLRRAAVSVCRGQWGGP